MNTQQITLLVRMLLNQNTTVQDKVTTLTKKAVNSYELTAFSFS